jgi:hypothetical protein
MQATLTQPGGSLTQEQKEFYGREGYLVIDHLLSDEELAPAREAMNDKVSEIADALYADGLISSKLEDEPFKTRLAKLFENLNDDDFLRWGRGWRDRRAGYYHLMSSPKILDAVESLIGGEIFSNPVYNTRPKVPKVAAGPCRGIRTKATGPMRIPIRSLQCGFRSSTQQKRTAVYISFHEHTKNAQLHMAPKATAAHNTWKSRPKKCSSAKPKSSLCRCKPAAPFSLTTA